MSALLKMTTDGELVVKDFRGWVQLTPTQDAELDAAAARELYRCPPKIPAVQLSSGFNMPLVGLGTWCELPHPLILLCCIIIMLRLRDCSLFGLAPFKDGANMHILSHTA
jgi:hypothetical protein